MIPIMGLQKTSLIDYPKVICTTIFLGGCNFKCPYCHNPDLVLKRGSPLIADYEVLEHLKRRKGLIDGLCVTGGEPSLHLGLPDFLRRVKSLGFLVKLDTNGTNPEMLDELISGSLVDYVAMDIKAPLERYSSVVRAPVNLKSIGDSIDIIRGAEIDYEFRTTVVPDLLNEEDILALGQWLKGTKKYVLQQFRPAPKMLDPSFKNIKPYNYDEVKRFQGLLKKYVNLVELRGIM